MNFAWISNPPILVTLAAVIAATVTDIKSHEVPDWVSYVLIACGLLFAGVDSIVWGRLTIISSVLGLALGYGIGALLYYTGQWGGGDAKLLMGLGATLTLPYTWILSVWQNRSQIPIKLVGLATVGGIKELPFFILFLVLLIFAGCAYGLVWMFILMLKHRRVFAKAFSKKVDSTYRTIRFIVLVVCVLSLIGAIIMRGVTGALLVLLCALVYSLFYLVVAVKIVEESLMRRQVKPRNLVEGDWVVGGARVGKKWVIPKDNYGATKEQIAYLRKKAPSMTLTIKEGIPFVPSFLVALLIALAL